MKTRPFTAILGCFLMYVGLGTLHMFGNITPYLTSYLRERVNNNTTYEKTSWIIYTTESIMSLIFIGVWLAERIGQKPTIVIGTVIFSFGITGTYWTIQHSMEATIASLGVVSNLGFICCFGLPVPAAMEWFPNNRGLVAGLVSSGAAFTPVLMNNFHTYFMNPNNVQPDTDGYFYDPNILDRVPILFLIMGALQGGILFIGLLLYNKPPSEMPKKENASERPVSVVQTEAKNCSASLKSGPDPEYKVCMLAFEEDCSMTSEGNSTNRKEEEAQSSLVRETFVTPKEALKTKEFYLFILTFISSLHSTMFVTSFYKTYGQTFIDDDTYLATTGSASAVVHAVQRLVMGLIQDKLFFKTTNLILMGLKTVLLFTLVVTPYGGKVMFIMWICALYATFPVELVCIPVAVAEVFGKKHTAMIYGMVYFLGGTSVIIWPMVFQVIIPYFGWFGTFCLIGSISLIGFLTSFVYPENYHTQPLKSSVCNDEREQALYGAVVWRK